MKKFHAIRLQESTLTDLNWPDSAEDLHVLRVHQTRKAGANLRKSDKRNMKPSTDPINPRPWTSSLTQQLQWTPMAGSRHWNCTILKFLLCWSCWSIPVANISWRKWLRRVCRKNAVDWRLRLFEAFKVVLVFKKLHVKPNVPCPLHVVHRDTSESLAESLSWKSESCHPLSDCFVRLFQNVSTWHPRCLDG